MESSTIERPSGTGQGSQKNPGLEKYELSDYKGINGGNFFKTATVLRRILGRRLPGEDKEAVFEHLDGVGEISAGPMNEMVFEAHKEEKLGHVESYDRAGNRVENIVYSPEQVEARKLMYETGFLNLDQHEDWNRPYHHLHMRAIGYLTSMNGEGGVLCPAGCSDGLITVLKELGTEEQKEKWLPFLLSPDSPAHYTAGQFLTERTGGSNIGGNRTQAVEGENGKWYLTGEKWFCSNPGDVWVTTAKIAGTEQIGLFLISKYKDSGEINDYHILRKKNIIGWRGKLTVEMEYRGVEAEILGRPQNGLRNMMEYVITRSRLGWGGLSAGISRRSFLEARSYAGSREAFGQKIHEFPAVARTLATMQVLTTASELAFFRTITLVDEKNDLWKFLMAMNKPKSSMVCNYVVHEAIIVHAGAGIISDYTVLPRMYDDSLIQEIGEGTHNIMASHAIKTFFRPKTNRAFFEEVGNNLKPGENHPILELVVEYAQDLKEQLLRYQKANIDSANWLPFLNKIYDLYVLSLLVREAVIDLEKNEDTFALMAQGYYELCFHGLDGLLPPDSPLMKAETTQKIIAV